MGDRIDSNGGSSGGSELKKRLRAAGERDSAPGAMKNGATPIRGIQEVRAVEDIAHSVRVGDKDVEGADRVRAAEGTALFQGFTANGAKRDEWLKKQFASIEKSANTKISSPSDQAPRRRRLPGGF